MHRPQIAIRDIHCTVIVTASWCFVVDCLDFGLNWMLGACFVVLTWTLPYSGAHCVCLWLMVNLVFGCCVLEKERNGMWRVREMVKLTFSRTHSNNGKTLFVVVVVVPVIAVAIFLLLRTMLTYHLIRETERVLAQLHISFASKTLTMLMVWNYHCFPPSIPDFFFRSSPHGIWIHNHGTTCTW